MADKNVPQHKRMAMGQRVNYRAGGGVSISNISSTALKSGKPDSPLEKAKRQNGVPGMRKGGKAC